MNEIIACSNGFQDEEGLLNVGRRVNLLKGRAEKTGTFLPGDRNVPVFVKVAAKI
jgi:hypothetical protein